MRTDEWICADVFRKQEQMRGFFVAQAGLRITGSDESAGGKKEVRCDFEVK